MRPAARLRSSLSSYPRLLKLLGFGLFLNMIGLSFLWPITTIYIHEHLGRPLTVAGIVLLLHSGGASLGNLAGGWLFDRIGGRRVLLMGLVASSVIIAVPGLLTSWPVFVAVMILYGFTMTMVFPAIYAMAAKAWPGGGRRAFNFLYVLHNSGVAVGTAVGGLLAARSFELTFLAAALLALGFGVFTFFAIFDEAPAVPSGAGASVRVDRPEHPIPWVPVSALFVGYLLLWTVYVQWSSALPVYMESVGIGLTSYSFLWTLNGLVIVLGQPVLAYAVRFARSLTAQLLLGTGLYIGAFALLLTSHQYSVYVAGMVILTFGEMLLWPGIPAAVEQMAPPSRRGFLQGFIASAATAGRMIGPIIGGLLYDHAGFTPLLIVMVSALSVPLISFLVYARTVYEPRPVPQSQTAIPE